MLVRQPYSYRLQVPISLRTGIKGNGRAFKVGAYSYVQRRGEQCYFKRSLSHEKPFISRHPKYLLVNKFLNWVIPKPCIGWHCCIPFYFSHDIVASVDICIEQNSIFCFKKSSFYSFTNVRIMMFHWF